MKNILVIEDDRPVRAGIVAVLRRHGFGVLDTGLGADGLALALAHPPDLILSDINLPGLNGMDVLKHLRARPETAAIPVVLMTGETHKVDARSSMTAGADDYLPKPFGMDQMLATVRARLDRQNNIQHALDAQNQAELLSAEEKIRLQTSALEAAANGIVITDRGGKILWVNPAFTQLTGYTFAEAVGQNPHLLKSGQHPPDFYANLWATISSGNVWRGELLNKRKDGSVYCEETTITPVCGADGEVQNFIAIKHDVTKRKQIEQALAHERDLLQTLMDNLPDHIYFKDAQSRFTRINQAHARHLGLQNPDEAIGKSDANFFPTHQARQKLADEQNLLAIGQPILGLVEESETAADAKWVSSTKVPIRGPDGKIAGLVGISRDITKSQRAEEELLKSERRYRDLFENMNEGFARCQMIFEDGQPTDFVYLAVNPMFTTLTGLKDVVGRRVTEVIPGLRESDPELFDIYGRVAATGKPEHFERYVNALQMWFDISVYRTEPGSFVTVFNGITGRKRAEEEMQRKTALLEAQMDSSIDGILVVNEQGRKTLQNQRLLRLFKIPQSIADDPDDEKSLAWVTQSIQNPEPFLERIRHLYAHPDEIGRDEIALKNGTVLDRYSAPMIGHNGQCYGRFWTFRDITERKRSERERQRIELQLRQAQKLESIGQLAAGIAHEINTPTQYVGDNTRFVKDSFGAILKILQSHEELLAAAKAGAVTPDLLSRIEAILPAGDLDYLREQIPQALDETLEGVERVTKIVRAMKDFSHPGGREKTPADLNKAIESTVTVARNEWKYVADLKLELEPNLPFVPCFLGEINQAVLNLIVNAAHAIGDAVEKNPGAKGTITVQTRRDGEHVEVRVADTGTGISEAARPKIFEPFFTTKAVGKGTGQGLAMIYGSVVNRHGGTVSFETEMGKGTTFTIRLPLKPKVGAETISQPQNPPA